MHSIIPSQGNIEALYNSITLLIFLTLQRQSFRIRIRNSSLVGLLLPLLLTRPFSFIFKNWEYGVLIRKCWSLKSMHTLIWLNISQAYWLAIGNSNLWWTTNTLKILLWIHKWVESRVVLPSIINWFILMTLQCLSSACMKRFGTILTGPVLQSKTMRRSCLNSNRVHLVCWRSTMH